MTDQETADDQDSGDDAFEWQNNRSIKLDKKSVASVVRIAELVMKHIGPYLLWVIAAIAWGIFIVSTFYAWSLVK